MTDVLTRAQRKLNMSNIRSRDTRPEKLLRGGLHQRGFRFRLHQETLPGHPDLVFPRYRAVILVHGCFWHGHNCRLFKLPVTRRPFWQKKISGNTARDARTCTALLELGWRVLVVWECALKGPGRWAFDEVLVRCENFLRSTNPAGTIESRFPEDSKAARLPSAPRDRAVTVSHNRT